MLPQLRPGTCSLCGTLLTSLRALRSLCELLRVYRRAIREPFNRKGRKGNPQRAQRKHPLRPAVWINFVVSAKLRWIYSWRERLRMARHKDEDHIVFTSNLLKGIRWAPVLFLPAPFQSAPFRLPLFETSRGRSSSFPFADFRLTPHYPAKSPLDDVLLKVLPGADEYLTEKYAFEIMPLLNQWSVDLRTAPPALASLTKSSMLRSRLVPATNPRSGAAFRQRHRGLAKTFREGGHPGPGALSPRDGKLSAPVVASGDGGNGNRRHQGNYGLRVCVESTFAMTWWARGRTADASSAWDTG